MDLKKFIGESTEYDKKQAVEMKKPKSWLKSVSAFANTVVQLRNVKRQLKKITNQLDKPLLIRCQSVCGSRTPVKAI